jgi:hypothetical protein
MNEHDIQPEPLFRRHRGSADAPMDGVDIRRSSLLGALHLAIPGFSLLACVVGSLGSALLLGIVVFHGQRQSWNFVVGYGIWDSLPYALLAMAIWRFRHSLPASSAMLVGTLAITVYGLIGLHHGLSEYFNPVPPGARCCFGPSAQEKVPILQALPVAGSWIFAGLLKMFGNRTDSAGSN